jgi:hypothetical protein
LAITLYDLQDVLIKVRYDKAAYLMNNNKYL